MSEPPNRPEFRKRPQEGLHVDYFTEFQCQTKASEKSPPPRPLCTRRDAYLKSGDRPTVTHTGRGRGPFRAHLTCVFAGEIRALIFLSRGTAICHLGFSKKQGFLADGARPRPGHRGVSVTTTGGHVSTPTSLGAH